MTKHVDSYTGQEFEVTEADMALVAPLGTEPKMSEEGQREVLVAGLKHVLRFHLGDQALPTGHWDAFIDEGDSQCGVADCPDGDYCCNADHHLVTRTSSTEHDSVFVRMHTEVHPEPLWDIEVMVRTKDADGNPRPVATIGATGEEYTPEACVNDLGVLLAVFRLYVQQGRL